MVKLPEKYRLRQRGQGLLEVLVALTLGVVLVGSLVVVVITSMKNSEYAQNQVKATKYAQEAMDQIRAIRDSNGTVNLSAGPPKQFGDLWGIQLSSTGDKYFKINGSVLDEVPSTFSEDLGGGLSRQITIEDDSSSYMQSKTVTVEVTWNDSTGTHGSTLQTYLTEYSYH